ncbi:MAG: Rpn family recombination-promoting nuclease/putative transposase [Anaerolineales bacterium]|nr:Rpn family recombination-promoting nuclease/putative transposase [Anaerolineales bacterium]
MLSPRRTTCSARPWALTKKADISSKRLIGIAPTLWACWLTGDATGEAGDLLANELQFIGRATDVVIKVRSPRFGDYLIANEIQFRVDAEMPRRMRSYAGLVEERHRLPVYPVVINIMEAAPSPSEYRTTFMGFEAVQQYRAINLWELDAAAVLAGNVPALLPFIPIMRGGDNIDIVKQALYALRSDPELADFEEFMAFIAGNVLPIETVRSIMRWDMAILRESPWYNEILQEGVDIGVEKGIGIGIENAMLSTTINALQRRFGQPNPALVVQLKQLSPNQLQDVIEVIYTAPSQQVVITYVDRLLSH